MKSHIPVTIISRRVTYQISYNNFHEESHIKPVTMIYEMSHISDNDVYEVSHSISVT
jgi:hypothetical protein